MPKTTFSIADIKKIIAIAYAVSPESVVLVGGRGVVSIGSGMHGEDITDDDPFLEFDSVDVATIPKSKKQKIQAAGVRFVPPTLQEVTAYCLERNNSVDPQKWYDHYSSNGWKVGRNPMKNWQAAVRTWERSEFNGQKAVQASGKPEFVM